MASSHDDDEHREVTQGSRILARRGPLTLEVCDQTVCVVCGNYFLAAAWGEPFGGLDGEELLDVVAGTLQRAGWDATAPDAAARAAQICSERLDAERRTPANRVPVPAEHAPTERVVARLHEIADLALMLGKVQRATRHGDGQRETDTTHTAMVGLLALELAPLEGYDYHEGTVAAFSLVHDLVEAIADDTDTLVTLSDQEAAAKASREAAAAAEIARRLGAGSAVAAWVTRYRAQLEPEARLVRAADKIAPLLVHAANGGDGLAHLGRSADTVRATHLRLRSELERAAPALVATLACFDRAHDDLQRVLAARGPAATGTVTRAPDGPDRRGGGL